MALWEKWCSSRINDFDTFLFDCDGVLWKGVGAKLEKIAGAIEAVNQLKSLGKRVLFISNNSAQSRAQYVSKLVSMGVNARQEDIFSSSYAAAAFLRNNNFASSNAEENKKVFVLGEAGLAEEIRSAGISVLEARTIFGSKCLGRAEIEDLKVDSNIKAVVVGMDSEFSFTKLCYSVFILNENSEALFISTNQDQTFPTVSRLFPGTGSIVAAVATSAMRQPINVGKPSSYLLDLIVEQFQLQDQRNRVLMVGDRLNTDIQFGRDGGLKTLLVFTGVTTDEELSSPNNNIYPDFIVQSVGDLFKDSS